MPSVPWSPRPPIPTSRAVPTNSSAFGPRHASTSRSTAPRSRRRRRSSFCPPSRRPIRATPGVGSTSVSRVARGAGGRVFSPKETRHGGPDRLRSRAPSRPPATIRRPARVGRQQQDGQPGRRQHTPHQSVLGLQNFGHVSAVASPPRGLSHLSPYSLLWGIGWDSTAKKKGRRPEKANRLTSPPTGCGVL